MSGCIRLSCSDELTQYMFLNEEYRAYEYDMEIISEVTIYKHINILNKNILKKTF